MSEHRATVTWQRSGEFRYETYSRSHALRCGAIEVPGNAAHERCFVANSVKSKVRVEPSIA